jgi:hypothetical protein
MSSYVKSIQVANGAPMLIIEAGNASLSPTLHIFALLAPTLFNNLLYISYIAKHLNYFVIFYSTHYVFQDNLTKRLISIGKERGGLYYLEEARASSANVFK